MARADTEDKPRLVGGGSANPRPEGGEDEEKMADDDQSQDKNAVERQVYLKFIYSENATKFC